MSEQNTNVVSVQLMFRHGVRSWVRTFPAEIVPAAYWDQFGGYAQLTSVGVKQMTEYGAYFKQYYQNMSIDIQPCQVFAKTTDFVRTIDSMKAFLKGMFEKNSILIETVPSDDDLV